MHGRILVTAFMVTGCLGTATAAPALADEHDDAFITVLDGQSIPYSSAANAIVLAQAVCDYVAAGQAPGQVAVEISGPANWSITQSDFFVDSATHTYCP